MLTKNKIITARCKTWSFFCYSVSYMEIYHGNIVYSESIKELKEIKSGYIIVDNGVIQGVYRIGTCVTPW